MPHDLRLHHLIVLCLIAGLAACAGASPREEIQLAVWHDGGRDDLKPLSRIILAAQRARPGLVVTLRVFPTANAYRQAQQWRQPGAHGVPDVVVLRDLWLPEFAGFLQPLNALLPARDLAPVPEALRARLRHAGNLYGVPWRVDARALFYRTDLFEAAGTLPPRTWEEALIAARRCHNPPAVYGFGLPGIRDAGAAELLLLLLWAHGTDAPPIERPELLCPKGLTTALQLYSDLHTVAEPEVLSWDEPALEEFFMAGRLAMLISEQSFAEDLAARAPDLEWATTPLPAGSQPAGFLGLDMACVVKGSAHHAGALTLLRAIASREGCEALMTLGSVPFRLDVAAGLRLDPAHAAYVARLEHARGLPPRRWDSARPILSDALFALLTGRKTVPEVAEFVQERFTKGEPLTARME